jgi:8-oxo-dGTP pyrophosphatase MutT (NUDIX family)
MHRNELIRKLRDYQTEWENESDTVERFIEFVSTNEDCFERKLKESHITGSAWVVSKDGRQVLLTHHKKLNRWFQLGGHADGNSDVLGVAMREAQEESGLERVVPISGKIFDVDIHKIPERGQEPEHHHYDVRYAFKVVGSEKYVVSNESHNLGWIEIEKLSELTEEESMLRMAWKWKTVRGI